MTTIDRLRVEISTPRGGTGSTSFYSVPGGGHQADVVTMLTTIKDVWAGGTTVHIPNTGEQLNDTNGNVVGAWTFGVDTTLTSANSSDYAAGVGVRLRWTTNGIRNNRHVIGTTFIVPVSVAAYDSDGTLDNAFVAVLQGVADDFLDDMADDLLIWSRPHVFGTAGTVDGIAHPVTGFQVPDKVAWLRSRKE